MLRVGQTANEPLAGNPARFIVRHAREGRRVGDRATARLTDACVAQVVRWKPQFPSVKFALNALADGRTDGCEADSSWDLGMVGGAAVVNDAFSLSAASGYGNGPRTHERAQMSPGRGGVATA